MTLNSKQTIHSVPGRSKYNMKPKLEIYNDVVEEYTDYNMLVDGSFDHAYHATCLVLIDPAGRRSADR